MYAKRVQLINCGPIDRLDISFPFNGDEPKPVLLVGTNGSGKSILLSHIVNGLLSAQGLAYPETPEVESGRVYKVRSPSYIQTGESFSFASVDFEDDLRIEELVIRGRKQDHSSLPPWLSNTNAHVLWEKMKPEDNERLASFSSSRKNYIENVFSKNCVLYFPPNRFEEPAWLNHEKLNARAEYMDLKNIHGYTNRKMINYSPLSDIQNWVFDVIYDIFAFEILTGSVHAPIPKAGRQNLHPVFVANEGGATKTYKLALHMVEKISGIRGASFKIGRRHARTISIAGEDGRYVPNIFQMSSGETSLLNLFLSILRDFDLSDANLERLEDIRGIVIVDEIDLHLHADHLHQILPNLIQMFPRVQFVVTSHSPLFVLGMERTFGEDGFALFRLPLGRQISPEEFSEFGSAYRAFAETEKFSEDIRQAVKESRKPVLFVEGKTNVKYIRRAAELLGKKEILSEFELKSPGGSGDLNKTWISASKLSEIEMQPIILLYDCDEAKRGTKDYVIQRTIPMNESSPLKKGIENLFDRPVLERALDSSEAFIDVRKNSKRVRGVWIEKPEEWTVNNDEKTNLCDWLCENGTVDDFQHFDSIFDLLENQLDDGSPLEGVQSRDLVHQQPNSQPAPEEA